MIKESLVSCSLSDILLFISDRKNNFSSLNRKNKVFVGSKKTANFG